MRASQYHALLVKQAAEAPLGSGEHPLDPWGVSLLAPQQQQPILDAYARYQALSDASAAGAVKTAGKSEGDKNWKTMPGVRAVVLDDKARVLLLKRPAHEVFHPNTWNLPGGAKERNEGFAQGAHRELKEETGLTATREGKVHHFTFPGGRGQAYLMRDHGGKLKVQPREVTEAKWFDPAKLPKKLFPQTKSIVEGLVTKKAHELYAAYKTAGLI